MTRTLPLLPRLRSGRTAEYDRTPRADQPAQLAPALSERSRGPTRKAPRLPASLTFPLFAALLAACPATTNVNPDSGRAPECQTRADCAAGHICTAQNYCDTCDSSGQCSLKEECVVATHLCALRDGWGTACVQNEDCQAGSWCHQGLCLDRAQVSLCPGGTTAECPKGDRCNKLTTVCEEDLGCTLNDDCSAGEVCNTGSRACVQRCTVDTQSTICAAGERCVGEKCVQCADASECGVGLVCDAAGRCVAGQRCYADRDCKVPLACFIQTGACLPKQPPCVSNDNCGADQRCEVTSGKCVPRACQPDRYEPDNDQTHAFTVAPGQLTGLTLCPGDIDWYALSLSRGDQLGVNVDADPFSENTFSTVIKDGTGRTVAAGRLLVSYVAPAPARYFVVISTTDAFQPYDVSFLVSRGVPCDDDPHEPDDTAGQAVNLNASTTLDGMICPQDQDWVHLAVPAGQGVTVSLANYDSSKGLLRLCLLADDGVTSLGCSDDLSPSVSAPAATVGGKGVYARVLGSTDRVSNAYTLQVAFP